VAELGGQSSERPKVAGGLAALGDNGVPGRGFGRTSQGTGANGELA